MWPMLPTEHLPNRVMLEQGGVVEVPLVPKQNVNGVTRDEAKQLHTQEEISTDYQKMRPIPLRAVVGFRVHNSRILDLHWRKILRGRNSQVNQRRG